MVAAMACPLRPAVLLVALAGAIHHHLPPLLDPWRYDGDARQHVFWTSRFGDPDLFPGDPLADFFASPKFAPPGYTLLASLGARHLDALLHAKLVALGLSLLLAVSAYRVGRRLGGPLAGLVLVCALAATTFDNLRTGLPRAFAWPTLALALDAIVHRSPLGAGLALALAAVFYPPLVPSLLPLLLLLAPGLRERPLRTAMPVLAGALCAVAVLASSYLASRGPDAGSFISAEAARARPEFQEHGRAEFWVPDPVRFWLGDFQYSRSACGLLSRSVLVPAGFALLLLLARRGRFRWPPESVILLVSGALLFLLAHALLFRLFLPSRYTIYAWPAALWILVAVNAAALVQERSSGAVRARAAWVANVLAALLLAGVLLGAVTRRSKAPPPERQELLQAIRALPKDALIAGYPVSLDDVPLLCRRSVFLNRETMNHYYERYDELVCRRRDAVLRLLHAPTRAEVLGLARAHGITHLLVEPWRYGDPTWSSRDLADPPGDRLLDGLRAETAYLAQPDPDFVPLHEGPRHRLFALPAP
jgi:hypothetical protein